MPSRPPRRLWLYGLLIWTVLGLLSAAQNAAWRTYSGRPVDWVAIVPNSLADWLTCGMFTPGFYWMVRRFPIRGERWGAYLPIHLAASLVFVVLKVTAYAPLVQLLDSETRRTWSMVLFGGFYADMLAYWASVGVIHAIEYYRESRERQLEATRLALENLRAQLQPHFLFNTLQSISTLIYRTNRRPIACSRTCRSSCACRSATPARRKCRSPRSWGSWGATWRSCGCASAIGW